MSTATLIHGYRVTPRADDDYQPPCSWCALEPRMVGDTLCEECEIQHRAATDSSLVWCMFPLLKASSAYRAGCRCSRHSTRKHRG